jgi:hypothetical protein
VGKRAPAALQEAHDIGANIGTRVHPTNAVV